MKHLPFVIFLNQAYEDIFNKFAENVYGCENMSVKKYGIHFKKQQGCHSRFLENHWYVLKLKILQLAVSDLHKM